METSFISTILPFIQLVLSVLLVVAIILQTRGSSLGGAFGGSDAGTTFYTRRGAEKVLFRATIALGVLFALSAFISLYVS
jgi:protein translocase SecG subunit